MISASHNPYEDNGIKLFGPDGFKLSDEVELEIEQRIDSGSGAVVPSHQLGRAQRLEESGHVRYLEFVTSSFPLGLRLDALKVVIACANGAAYHVAPGEVYELGAALVPDGVYPAGLNINTPPRSTHPASIHK